MAKKPVIVDTSTIRRISDLVPLDDQKPPVFNAADMGDNELLLMDFEFIEGEVGDYYLMTCQRVDNNEEIMISCGAYPVKKTLEILGADKTILPLQFHFVKSGKTWLME